MCPRCTELVGTFAVGGRPPIPEGQRKISVRLHLDPKTLKQLQEVSDRTGVSIGALMRGIIEREMSLSGMQRLARAAEGDG